MKIAIALQATCVMFIILAGLVFLPPVVGLGLRLMVNVGYWWWKLLGMI